MDHSPTARLIALTSVFTLMMVVTFVTFSYTGTGLKSSPLFSRSYEDVTYEIPAEVKAALTEPDAPRETLPQWPRTNRPVGVPETAAEEAYYAAVLKQDSRSQRTRERLKPKEDVHEFLETPEGRELKMISAIAKRGRGQEAYLRLKALLDHLDDKVVEVRLFVLKFAVRMFKLQNDSSGLEVVVRRYLEEIRSQIADFESGETARGSRRGADTAESLHKVDDLLQSLEVPGRG